MGSLRTRVVVGVFVVLVLASFGTYAFISSSQKPTAAPASAVLTIYKGSAQRAVAGSSIFSAATTGQVLNGGDQVRTGGATAAAIRFGDGSITRLDSNTALSITTLSHHGSQYQTSLAQSTGKTWNRVLHLVGAASFRVSGPNSSTAEVRGTTFALIVEPNGDVRVDDYAGTVIFTGKSGSGLVISTGQSSTLLSGTNAPQAATTIPTADLQDQFTIFNVAADANETATGGGDILSVSANNTIAVGETAGTFTGGAADGNSDLSFTLDWPGSTFELVVVDPDGEDYDSVISDQHPVTYTVPKARVGAWSYRVHDISSAQPTEQWSVVVGAIRPAQHTPTLFFRGGAKQVCDHTVNGGQTDTWTVRARDASGVPSLSSSQLPDYGNFSDGGKGKGTFKFAPPADVPPADLPITITADFGGGTATLSCIEHVIPPRKSSVGGSVLNGSSGVSGVLVTLTAPDATTQSALTDGAGNFGFTGLGAGNFSLAVTVPAGYKPTAASSQPFTLDGNTAGAPVIFQLAPFSISPTSLPNGSVGDPLCTVLSVVNGVAPIHWTVTGGSMPTGTGFDSYGHCNGTPTVAGNYSFTLTASDANGNVASRTYPLQIFPAPDITASDGLALEPIANLRHWDTGFANPQTLAATGGIQPYNWSVVSGSLPNGMSLDAATGTLGGVPTDPAGDYAAGIQLSDAVGAKAYRTVFVTLDDPPAFFGGTVTNAVTLGQPYSHRLGFNGSNGPFTTTATNLPPGIVASVVGTEAGLCDCSDPTRVELTGTPTARGVFTPTVTVRDSVGGTATTATLTINVVFPGVSIVETSLPPATLNAVYSAVVTPTGGLGGAYTLYPSGNLPAGITYTRTSSTGPGQLRGTPTECGTFPLDFVVYDPSGSNSATMTLAVGTAVPTICTPVSGTLPASAVGATGYSVPLVAAGGAGPYTWTVSGGPADLVVSGSNLVGPPTGFTAGDFSANGPWNVTLVATDSLKVPSSRVTNQLTISPAPVLTTPAGPLPGTTAGAFYQQAFTVNGNAPTGLQVAPGSTLPPGLYLTVSNQCAPLGPCLQGNPTQVGNFSFYLVPTDSTGGVGAAVGPYTLVVSPPPPLAFTTTSPLPASMVGGTYSAYVAISGGLYPHPLSVVGGALPPGLTLNPSTGVISGTPTTAGTFTPTLQVSDGGANPPVSMQFTIVIDPTLAVTAPLALPGGDGGVAYSQAIGASGGSGSSYVYSFGCYQAAASTISSLSSGCSAPPGLAIDSTGLITGSPTAGSYRFSVRVGDSDGNSASRNYSVNFAPPVVIATASLPNATLRSAYCQSLAAGGGTPAYSWAVTAGSLPVGLRLDSYGHLTGTPITTGVFTFTVTATDTAGGSAQANYTITIS